MKEPTVEVRPVQYAQLECSSCGANAYASCDCGASYVPKGERARRAVLASPEMSDRAIAKELGISHVTVNAARNQLLTTEQLEASPRIGLDGKLRQLPTAHVSHNSGENEWYTPADIIAAARAVMGSIDLDPASHADANEVVGAAEYFTAKDDGLTKPWHGRVWMNPPYAQPLIGLFCDRLASSLPMIDQAVSLTNNGTETRWGQALLLRADAVCFPSGRVSFWAPGRDSATPLQGQMMCYFGKGASRFAEVFSRFGCVK